MPPSGSIPATIRRARHWSGSPRRADPAAGGGEVATRDSDRDAAGELLHVGRLPVALVHQPAGKSAEIETKRDPDFIWFFKKGVSFFDSRDVP